MKKPEECTTIEDIRAEIDRIDQEIICLISERASYVKAAVKFKKEKKAVNAQERVKSLLEQRGRWAEEYGLDTNIIQQLFSNLVNHFIKEKMEKWETIKTNEVMSDKAQQFP
ncbi:MAG: isochorismate lyase [bacterium]